MKPTVLSLHTALQAGDLDPLMLAHQTIDKVKEAQSDPRPLDAFVAIDELDVLAQAEASALRWSQNKPRGDLDGIPVAIKDACDVKGYATSAGTSFMGTEKALRDAALVERLRQAGAIIFGKTALTEIGLGGIGANPNQLTPRNPHNREYLTGGSSSGSAAAVAASIVPVALGTDAGGSIRMPAAICGVAGFKPTYGRIPSDGIKLLAWTLDHAGPLGQSVGCLAAFYDVTAGPDPRDRTTLYQPRPRPLGNFRPASLQGLKVAYCPDFGDDADEGVRQNCHQTLTILRENGATVGNVKLEFVREIQKVGYLTIATEAAASQKDHLRENRRLYARDTRMLLATGESISAVEYLHAQRIRTLIVRQFEEIFESYDIFVHPTLAITAPSLSESDIKNGVVHPGLNDGVTRYTFAATLTGMPAISLPNGFVNGLPTGFQLMGPAYSDERLLRIAAGIEGALQQAKSVSS